MTADQTRIEVERLTNLVRNFDWIIQKQELLPDKIIITLEKSRPPSELPSTAGPD